MARQLLIAALLTMVACTGSPDASDDEAGTAATGTVPPPPGAEVTSPTPKSDGATSEPAQSDDCDVIDRTKLVRSQSTPGGHRMHLQVTDRDGGVVMPERIAECMTVTSDRLGALDAVVAETSNEGGATLIVARWIPGEVDTSRAVIDELLATLPPDERVAVWAWSDELLQVIGATTDRERIVRRLDAVWSADDAPTLDPADAAEAASEEWEDYGDDRLLGVRSVVFVAPTLDLGERPDIDRDVVVDHWIVRSGEGGRVVEVGENEDVAAIGAGATVGARIELDRIVPLTLVDFCDDGDSLDLTLSVGERKLRAFGIADAAVEHVGAACSVEALRARADTEQVSGGSELLSTINVSFDGAERAVFDEARAIADGLSGRDRFDGDVDPEWTGSISFDGGVTNAPFEASFRGQSSIECERRNWSVDLQSGDARHPISGSGTDDFALASLCNDAGYVNTLTGSAVMSQFDVWAQATGTSAFEVDGENRGVYLLVEDPDADLRFETSRVSTVLRRRYDALGVDPDVKYVADMTSNDEPSILATYDALVDVATSTSGDEMVAALRARFDLDQYLRWTAVMSLLGSGDHIDELYFVGSESVDAQHEPIIWFTVNGWDPDDLFAPCHRDGRLAIDDPNGLLSCTESLLDQQLFGDPVLYALYADVLAGVVDDVTQERFTQIADESAGEITRHLDDPDVVAAMIELVALDASATTPEAAVQAVDDAAGRLVEQFDTRRSELLDLLDAYRSAKPPT